VALRFLPGGPPNTPPVADDQAVTTDEDTVIDITLTASDDDGDPLTFAIVDGPSDGTLSGTPPDVTYTPDPDSNGEDSFTFKANDGIDDSNIATVTVTVDPVNDAPEADPQTVTTDEDVPVDITLTGSDVDGDSLAFLVTSGPSHGTLSGSDDLLTYTPDADYHGSDSFDFVVNDGTEDSAAATVTIDVGSVNDPPVASDDGYTTDEDTPLAVGAPGVLANDTDTEGDALSALLAVAPSSGILDLSADGSFTYTPDPDFNGTDTFTYTAFDGADHSNIATVTIGVTPVNDPPDAVDDQATTEEDQFVDIAVLVNDTDPDGDTLTITFVGSPLHGTAEDNEDGTIRYTPNAGYTGSDDFSYTIGDGHDGADTASVHVTVTEINDPPVADDQSVETDEDIPLAANLTATDPEGSDLTYLIVTDPAHGTLSGTPPAVTYTPRRRQLHLQGQRRSGRQQRRHRLHHHRPRQRRARG